MSFVLALDAMGGDLGPQMVFEGARRALAELGEDAVSFLFYGNEKQLMPILSSHKELARCAQIVHADTIVTAETKPTAAVRMGRTSHLAKAVDAVANKQAHAVVSAGNTGAYMALSKILLKTLSGIDRPAIPAVMPNIHDRCVVLDLGANIDCSPENLVQFALMGEAFAAHMLKKQSPSIGLLNVGTEELKGNAVVQAAAQFLKNLSTLNFHGFVEGDDIALGKTDVIVTDGFSGNIALKAIEGTAKLMKHFLKESLSHSLRGKLGYLVARTAFKELQDRMDPRLYNGAVFLGLQHIAVKSHGGTDAIGFANAIKVAVNMLKVDLIKHLEERLMLLVSTKESHETL